MVNISLCAKSRNNTHEQKWFVMKWFNSKHHKGTWSIFVNVWYHFLDFFLLWFKAQCSHGNLISNTFWFIYYNNLFIILHWNFTEQINFHHLTQSYKSYMYQAYNYPAVRTGSSNTHFFSVVFFLVVTCPRPPAFRSAKQILVVSFATQARAFILSDRNIFYTPRGGGGENNGGV